MPLPIQTSSDPEASVKSLGHHQQTSDKPKANQEDTRAKMVFWVRFVFRALSSHVRGTFYGYGHRDLGFPTLGTHSDRCEGLTFPASATSP